MGWIWDTSHHLIKELMIGWSTFLSFLNMISSLIGKTISLCLLADSLNEPVFFQKSNLKFSKEFLNNQKSEILKGMPPLNNSTFFRDWSKEIALNFPTIFALDDSGKYYTEEKYLLDGIETRTILSWNIATDYCTQRTLTLKLKKENRIYDLTLTGADSADPRFYLVGATMTIEEPSPINVQSMMKPIFEKIQNASPIYLDTGYSSVFYSPGDRSIKNISTFVTERKSQCDICEYDEDPNNCAFGNGEYDEDGEEEPCPGFSKKLIKTERDIIL